MPIDRLIAGLPKALANLSEDNWFAAAHAIMTTDTVAKAASKYVKIIPNSTDREFLIEALHSIFK